MTVYYYPDKVFKEKYDIEEAVIPCTPQSSQWLSTIPLLVGGFKTVKEWFTKFNHHSFDDVPTTIRVCPGIKDLMQQSVLIKFHHDLLLETYEDDNFKWRTPEAGGNIRVEMHPSLQYMSEKSQLFRDQVNVKLIIPINFHSKGPLMFLNPYYHQKQPYSVMPGLITNINGNLPETAINLMFPRMNATYHFKRGEPLCYGLNLNGTNKLVEKQNNIKLVRKEMLNNYNRAKNKNEI